MSVSDKEAAARAALAYVDGGMRLGLGTGSTTEAFVRLLGERVRDGLKVTGVPTSERTQQLAQAEGVPLAELDGTPLDLAIDGADEMDPQLRLVKGGGGSLLREKIVAAASRRMIVIADASKRVERLGRFPLPVEVVPFGLAATRAAVARAAELTGCPGPIVLRERDGHAFVTDNGNHILDLAAGAIPDAEGLAAALARIPGVVEHGLFLAMASLALVASNGDVETIEAITA